MSTGLDVMHHTAQALQAALCFSAGVGAKSLYDWYLATRRRG